MTKHTGRRLTWQTNQGSADVKTLYTPKPYELSVSTYQLCILLQFNHREDISLGCVSGVCRAPCPCQIPRRCRRAGAGAGGGGLNPHRPPM
jgi:hypothetical protein